MDSLTRAILRSGSNRLCSFLMNTKEAGEPRKDLCSHRIAEHGPKTSLLRVILAPEATSNELKLKHTHAASCKQLSGALKYERVLPLHVNAHQVYQLARA